MLLFDKFFAYSERRTLIVQQVKCFAYNIEEKEEKIWEEHSRLSKKK